MGSDTARHCKGLERTDRGRAQKWGRGRCGDTTVTEVGKGWALQTRANDNAHRGQLGRGTTSVLYTSSRRCFEMGSAVRTESSKQPSISAYTISYAAHSQQGENRTAQIDTIIHRKHDGRATDKQLHCTSEHSIVTLNRRGTKQRKLRIRPCNSGAATSTTSSIPLSWHWQRDPLKRTASN